MPLCARAFLVAFQFLSISIRPTKSTPATPKKDRRTYGSKFCPAMYDGRLSAVLNDLGCSMHDSSFTIRPVHPLDPSEWSRLRIVKKPGDANMIRQKRRTTLATMKEDTHQSPGAAIIGLLSAFAVINDARQIHWCHRRCLGMTPEPSLNALILDRPE